MSYAISLSLPDFSRTVSQRLREQTCMGQGRRLELGIVRKLGMGMYTLLHFIFLFYFILFLNMKHCISFAKHQNESATGIHRLPALQSTGNSAQCSVIG